eukprot:337000-Chlamydomonas_euryale.AAC.3
MARGCMERRCMEWDCMERGWGSSMAMSRCTEEIQAHSIPWCGMAQHRCVVPAQLLPLLRHRPFPGTVTTLLVLSQAQPPFSTHSHNFPHSQPPPSTVTPVPARLPHAHVAAPFPAQLSL